MTGVSVAESIEDKVRKLTIIALVSDDALMEKLVLKGGNAIPFYGGEAPVRRSLDLDFSLDGDLGPIEKETEKMERLLRQTLKPERLEVFDVRLEKAPPGIERDTLGDFWGGYTLEFKVLSAEDFGRLAGKPEKRSLQAIESSPGGKRTFTVDMSRHEHCKGKVPKKVGGFTVFVYSPTMLVCEKIRAICQQMEEYRRIVESRSRRPRARDFYDIHALTTQCGVKLDGDEAWEHIKACFRAKRVPLPLLGRISAEREFHRENFQSVRDTVPRAVALRDFDFYVEHLVGGIAPLQPRWEMDPPVG